MAVIDVTLGKRVFQLACDDGQEVGLRALAQGVNARMQEVDSQLAGETNDTMLLVMSALMMQDEISEGAPPKPASPTADDMAKDAAAIDEEVDSAIAEALDAIADYVENIAERVEKA